MKRGILAAVFCVVSFVSTTSNASAQTFTSYPYGMWIMRPLLASNGAASFATVCTLDAAGESCGWIFTAPKTGSIRSCSFRTGTVTTGDAALGIRLETVSATDGLPTGSLVAANTESSHTLDAAHDDQWIKGTNFTANASVTRGSLYSCVVVTNAPGNFTIQGFSDDGGGVNVPYQTVKVGAGPTWAKVTPGSVAPVFAVEYSDGTYAVIPGAWPIETVATATYNTSTASNDEHALEFSVPSTTQIGGAWVYGNVGGGASLVFYDGTTAITDGTCAFDADQIGATGTNITFCTLPANITILANTTYRASWRPATTTNISLQEFDVDTGVGAALMDAIPGGQAFRYASRVDDGSWAAATTTKRPFMGLLITGVASSGGGGHIIGGQ